MNALERAARKVISVVISDTDTITEASDVVAILERELHWTELVEAAKATVSSSYSSSVKDWGDAMDSLRSVLSKIERGSR